MKTKFNFKSAICTSREQSERLLALGLKKETADMEIWFNPNQIESRQINVIPKGYFIDFYKESLISQGSIFTPSWTFDRLLELMPQNIVKEDVTCFQCKKCTIQFCLSTTPLYNSVEYGMPVYFNMQYLHQERKGSRLESAISMCNWLIKDGYFNKEYLENGKE